ncbi:uncharacterized protein [Rutidosis leptorrhynchoides]|uniref:uncharacterized protein isoform X2 n=1 Tax=Rutidosis leptorrhynchoides TaxID=125765 RepID=UPI003A9A5E98
MGDNVVMGGIIKLWCCLKKCVNRNATFIYISRNRLFYEEISLEMCLNESWIDGDFIGNDLPTSILGSYYEVKGQIENEKYGYKQILSCCFLSELKGHPSSIV